MLFNTRLKFSICLAFTFGLVSSFYFSVPFSHASFLRLTPEVEVKIDPKGKNLLVHWRIKNEGDEKAREVALDFPDIAETLLLTKSLNPQESTETHLSIPYSRLEILHSGTYGLPYRILYRDENFFPFSAAQIQPITIPPSHSVSLSVTSTSVEVPLSGDNTGTVSVRNVSSLPAEIKKLAFISSLELEVIPDPMKLPIVLEPGASHEIHVRIRSLSALTNSTYRVWALISGVTGDHHFAEPVNLTAHIVNAMNLRLLIALGILVVTMVIFAIRSGKKEK